MRFQVQFPDYGHGALVRLGDLDTRSNDSNGESLLKGKKLKVAQSQQSQACRGVRRLRCDTETASMRHCIMMTSRHAGGTGQVHLLAAEGV